MISIARLRTVQWRVQQPHTPAACASMVGKSLRRWAFEPVWATASSALCVRLYGFIRYEYTNRGWRCRGRGCTVFSEPGFYTDERAATKLGPCELTYVQSSPGDCAAGWAQASRKDLSIESSLRLSGHREVCGVRRLVCTTRLQLQRCTGCCFCVEVPLPVYLGIHTGEPLPGTEKRLGRS